MPICFGSIGCANRLSFGILGEVVFVHKLIAVPKRQAE